MTEKDLDARIGEAWKAHYAGEYYTAVEQFKLLAAEAPDHIDAQWGLGLSYRHVGEKEKALAAFEQAKALIDAEISANPGEHGRLFMLNRMVTQQIEQIADFLD